MTEETKPVVHNDESDDETVEDVLNSMNEKQKKVLMYLMGKTLQNSKKKNAQNIVR